MAFYELGSVYVGKECRKCGGKVRYKNSRRCVACKHALSASEWSRKKAVADVLERHGDE